MNDEPKTSTPSNTAGVDSDYLSENPEPTTIVAGSAFDFRPGSKNLVSPEGRGFGLLTPARQRLFIKGIAKRCDRGLFDRQTLNQQHQVQVEQLEAELTVRHSETTARCRQTRRDVLHRWDIGDEQAMAHYESSTLKTRDLKNRDLVSLRRERKKSVADEEQKYDAAVGKVTETYKLEKPKIGSLQKRENEKLVGLKHNVSQTVDLARELTLRRLGSPGKLATLIEQGAEQTSADKSACESLPECFTELEAMTTRSKEIHGQMNSGLAVKFVESFYLVFVVLAILLVWCGAAYAIAPENLAMWMLVSLPVAMAGGFLAHTLFATPLRKSTRLLHPEIERILNSVESLFLAGQTFAADKATRKLAELRKQRDERLENLRLAHEHEMLKIKTHFREREEELIKTYDAQLHHIESSFQNRFSSFATEMKTEAEQEAQKINTILESERSNGNSRREQLRSQHEAKLAFLQNRVHTGVAKAFQRALVTAQVIDNQFPAWPAVIAAEAKNASPYLRWLPLGHLSVGTHLSDVEASLKDAAPENLPLVLSRETQSALIIECPGEQMHVAAEWVRGVLWRAITSVVPGRVRLTLLDTVGRGENFASLVALGDHDPSLIGHRAWSATGQVSTRLSELTQYIEDILQTCLRDRYATIEDFNREAGALAEPYRVVAAFGVPTGLSRDGIESLRALVEGGRRCGVFSIIVRDLSQPWPAELPPLPESHVLRLRIDDAGKIRHTDPALCELSISPVAPPPANEIPGLAERIGLASLAANRVEIPLDDLVPAVDYDTQDSASGLSIPVGRQGVGRSLDIQLGAGMRQHMLVAGKTGSGKSTLLHSMIMSAAMRYSPDQLHLYLLDFKKGVEFKIYADTGLPHARVIGIESEREFGRSVLNRLDEELQQRGELFRSAGVQEMAEYRRKTDQDLPRVLLIVDEFQELFTRDDRVAQECTMLLDRLVRQGRSFGMHVVLSSQSLAGAYTLPRATLGQMAVRIALQCSEADAAMILADDNTAARLLTRPGEAIFNDAGGLVEGNQPFQIAWLGSDLQRTRLSEIRNRHHDAAVKLGPALIFEGNRPSVWTTDLADAALRTGTNSDVAIGLLGEAVRIGPPTGLRLNDNGGRNVLCVADQNSVAAVLASWLSSAAKSVRARTGGLPRVIVFEGRRGDDQLFSLSQWLEQAGIENQVIRPRDSQAEIVRLADEMTGRASNQESSSGARATPTLVVVDELERFRDFKQDDTFGFSLDGSSGPGGGASFQKLLSEGPPAGYHSFIGCGGAESLSRWLPRTSQHDLELRIVGRISANDSAQLIDTPEASNLSPASMLLYDDADGSLEKFRLCEIPSAEKVREWLFRDS